MISSVYIHIPFCSNICSYCNFAKFYYNKNMVNSYLNSLEKEIKLRYKGETIKTLYIGGGTPSSLTLDELERLFKILEVFKKDKNIEFTIEVNPENLTLEKIKLFKKYQVTRISMGVESTNKKFLDYLGRHHDFNKVRTSISLLKKKGFTNINVDLIYALKEETFDDLKSDILNLISLDVPHISTYSLMIEEGTILGIKHEQNIDEDKDYLMYDLIRKTLKKYGYKHYEISNFAKEGYESKHNLVYWNNDYYYGFGLGAASYIPGKRITNTYNYNKYIKCDYVKEIEELTKKDILSYALILGFRKIDGINKKDFFNKYNVELESLYNIKELVKEKKLIDNGMNIFVSYDKIYIENSILINFVGE